jgi:hypothetical protein
VQVPTSHKTMADTVDDILQESASLTDRKKLIAEYWAEGVSQLAECVVGLRCLTFGKVGPSARGGRVAVA